MGNVAAVSRMKIDNYRSFGIVSIQIVNNHYKRSTCGDTAQLFIGNILGKVDGCDGLAVIANFITAYAVSLNVVSFGISRRHVFGVERINSCKHLVSSESDSACHFGRNLFHCPSTPTVSFGSFAAHARHTGKNSTINKISSIEIGVGVNGKLTITYGIETNRSAINGITIGNANHVVDIGSAGSLEFPNTTQILDVILKTYAAQTVGCVKTTHVRVFAFDRIACTINSCFISTDNEIPSIGIRTNH